MGEKRNHQRRSIEYSAWIDHGGSLHKCRVKNVSLGGAKIILSNSSQLPAQFELILTNDRQVRRVCRLVRQEGDEIGVQFLYRKGRNPNRNTTEA